MAQMATRISIANIARVSVGVVATIWALLGLGSALAAGWGHGVNALVTVAVVANLALIAAAILAFVTASYWRVAMICAIAAVTVDRIVNVLGTGDFLPALSSLSMLVAVIGITIAARPR